MNKPTKIIDSYGDVRYYLNGKVHRDDGPAVEGSDGYKAWYINGKLHRTDGPAIEHSDGSKEWWVNGELHRTDGPAIDDSNGTKEWWIDDEKVTLENYQKYFAEYQDLVNQFLVYQALNE